MARMRLRRLRRRTILLLLDQYEALAQLEAPVVQLAEAPLAELVEATLAVPPTTAIKQLLRRQMLILLQPLWLQLL